MKRYGLKRLATAWVAAWSATFLTFAAFASLDAGREGVSAYLAAVWERADLMPPAAKLVLGAVLLAATVTAARIPLGWRLFVGGLGGLAGLIAAAELPAPHALIVGDNPTALAAGAIIGGSVLNLVLTEGRRVTRPQALR